MIFVSVGTQLPFERLIRAMDGWAQLNPSLSVFAQIGATEYKPESMPFKQKLSPTVYDDLFARSEIIVSHAGMGTIINGLEKKKKMILMPRRFELQEHRNNHQISTAEHFKKFDLVDIVEDEASLFSSIERCLKSRHKVAANENLAISQALIDRIDTFINENTV